MLKSSITPGGEYAFRERRTPRGDLQRVRIIEHLRGNKWKVEWIEPNPGLVHYVESGQLVATWKEHKAFLKEEDAEIRLREENERSGYRKDSPVDRAMYQVFESAGDDVSYYNGTLSADPDAMARVRARAGWERARVRPSAMWTVVGDSMSLSVPRWSSLARSAARSLRPSCQGSKPRSASGRRRPARRVRSTWSSC